MPVILYIPQDPTDLVVQDDQQLFAPSYAVQTYAAPSPYAVMLQGVDLNLTQVTPLVTNLETYYPEQGGEIVETVEVLRDPFVGSHQGNNSGIATPCGAIYPLDRTPLMNAYVQHTGLWAITGVTRDGAGSPLGGCDVLVEETGRQTAFGQTSYVGGTVSDGSGNFSLSVPMNTTYQIEAFFSSSPDRAGISVRNVTPTAAG